MSVTSQKINQLQSCLPKWRRHLRVLPIVHTIVQFSVPTTIQIVCIMSGQTCFQKTSQHRLGSLNALKALPPFARCGIPAKRVQLSQDIERHLAFLYLRPPDITSFETAHFQSFGVIFSLADCLVICNLRCNSFTIFFQIAYK